MKWIILSLALLATPLWAANLPDGIDILTCDNGTVRVIATNRGFIFQMTHDEARRHLDIFPEYSLPYFEVEKIPNIQNIEFTGKKFSSYPYGRIYYVKRDNQSLVVESFKAAQSSGGAPLEQREKIGDWKWHNCKFTSLN